LNIFKKLGLYLEVLSWGSVILKLLGEDLETNEPLKALLVWFLLKEFRR
jgi:hypothetical protein